jgi:hypothetical protein
LFVRLNGNTQHDAGAGFGFRLLKYSATLDGW